MDKKIVVVVNDRGLKGYRGYMYIEGCTGHNNC